MKRLFYFPFLLILYEFVLIFSNDMYIPAMPSLVSYMRVDYTCIQLTVVAWLAGMAAVALFLCPLFDCFGKRRVLLSAGAAFAFMTLICSVTNSVSFLIIARILQGASVCCFLIGGYALVHELYEHQHALRMIMWMISVSILAPMIGPFIGGLVLILGSWRMIFGILFGVGIIILIPLWLAMPNKLQKKQAKRIVCSRNLRNKPFLFGALSLSCLYATLFVWITASPFLIIDLLHYQPYQFGLAQTPIFGAFFVGFYLLRPIMRKLNKNQTLHIGLFFAFASALFLFFWNMYSGKNLTSLVIPMACMCLGFGLAVESLYRLILFSQKEGNKEEAVAALYFLLTAVAAVGTFAMSVIHETFLSVIGVLIIFVSLACLGVFALEKAKEK